MAPKLFGNLIIHDNLCHAQQCCSSRTKKLPGIRIVWLHPYCSRTIGDVEDIGERLTAPVSCLTVRVPFTLSSQSPLAR